MNTIIAKRTRRNALIRTVLPVATAIGLCVLVSAYSVKAVPAVFLLILAIDLFIRQKRLFVCSLLLVVGSLLFLLSGATDDINNNVLRSLPVISQIEFSKVEYPGQLSLGLATLGTGTALLGLSLGWLFLRRIKSEHWKAELFLSLTMSGISIVFVVLGIFSAINGFGRF